MTNEEKEAAAQLLKMTRAELDLVDFDLKKWCCHFKNCSNGTIVRDYGIGPTFYLQRGRGEFCDLEKTIWLCGKHRKFVKRLEKTFDWKHIFNKLMNPFPASWQKVKNIEFKKTKLIENEFTNRLETRAGKTRSRNDRPSLH